MAGVEQAKLAGFYSEAEDRFISPYAPKGRDRVSLTWYVYFIQEEKLSVKAPVKIGVAKNIERRMRTLQVGNPRRLLMRHTIGPMSQEAAYKKEKDLHDTFKRYRLCGEWFSGKVLKKITTQ